MRLPRLITDAPRASSRGSGRVFLSRKVGSRAGVTERLVCAAVPARGRALVMSGLPAACGYYLATSSGAAIPLGPHRSVS